MKELALLYSASIWAMGVMGGLFLVQLLVADFAGILSKHAPGSPVAYDPKKFLFRAVRAHANTNESIGGFVLVFLFCLFASVSPKWLAACSWVFVGARVLHMLFYYADMRWFRIVAFAVGFVDLFVMFFLGLLAFWG